MNEPLLTVVIPVYNAEAYVRRAAASVLNQPCADRLELILVDDGSTDGSGALCDQIAAESSSAAAVRVIHQKNGGVSSARNLGIQESRTIGGSTPFLMPKQLIYLENGLTLFSSPICLSVRICGGI